LIILQLKSTQDEAALAGISSIIKTLVKDCDYKIKGHEVHQTKDVMAATTLRERVEMISRFCIRNEIDYLTYHAPIFCRGQNIWQDAWKDGIKQSISLTVEEASRVKREAGISRDVVIVFHLTNYISQDKLPRTIDEKLRLFEAAENEFARIDCSTNGCVLALENTYPRCDAGFENAGPFHPQELVRIERHGVRTALDIAHYQLYINYLKSGIGNVIGDIDKRKYRQAPSWSECLKILSKSLALLHISDAKGLTVEGEGLVPGQGEIPLVHVLREAGSGKAVQGTIELNNGHLNKGELQLESAKWLLQHARDVF
jgi:sugar phosphate isomerase/epimerase